MIRRRATLLLGVVGLALLGAAAARVIYTSSGAGIVTLLVIGAVLLVSPFVIARVERLSINSGGFGLQLSRELADAGAPNTARILEHADLGRFAEAYAVVHTELDDRRYEDARSHLQDLLIQRSATLARQEKFDPSLADGATILAAIADPRSPSEQTQGLELAKACWPQMSKYYRSAIQSVIADNAAGDVDTDRRRMAAEVRALPVT